ncbi:hypothetical protein SLEP1_g60464 [Rubroshorea leprosula]|uniref:Uncharacterized protein n=1 Tax=Rubroshorea leprosula TaxID=152421 RepID=A0AAV5MVC8_9ROSI|nr:hypothetical protein SLEP1_g60464 [Rubroshorea leprosula]
MTAVPTLPSAGLRLNASKSESVPERDGPLRHAVHDWDVRLGRVRRRVALLLRSSERTDGGSCCNRNLIIPHQHSGSVTRIWRGTGHSGKNGRVAPVRRCWDGCDLALIRNPTHPAAAFSQPAPKKKEPGRPHGAVLARSGLWSASELIPSQIPHRQRVGRKRAGSPPRGGLHDGSARG